MWSEGTAADHGTHVQYDSSRSWPKALQQPQPPIRVAGNVARTLQRVARYGDGWLPLASGVDSFGDAIKELEDNHVNQFISYLDAGGLDFDQVSSSLRLFSEKVMPNFR